MYNLQELIDHLAAELPTYKVDWARAKEMDLGTALDPVMVKVGYHSVEGDGNMDEVDAPDFIQTYSQDLQQFIIVQFTCSVAEFHNIWQIIYAACASWDPIPAEGDYSNLMHSGGGAMGLKDGKIWWLDKWRLNFPKVTTEFP